MTKLHKDKSPLSIMYKRKMRDWPQSPSPRFRRAVFLDRDGTINVDSHYPHRIETMEFIPMAVDGLRLLATLPLDVIVISNQAGIALGIFTKEQMSKFNAELRRRIEHSGCRIDAFYFCPHLEPSQLPQGAPPCSCSKPSPGMLLEATQEFELDLVKSFVIGDKTSDIVAGETASCTTILVKTGKGGVEDGASKIEPDHVAQNLYEASLIVKSYF